MALSFLFGCCSKDTTTRNDVTELNEADKGGPVGGGVVAGAGAVGVGVGAAGESVHERHEFTLEVHGAQLDRSFAKIGWMDPYAIVQADGKEVARTKTAVAGHRQPDWSSSHKFAKGALPDMLTIQVWDKNNFHKDVFCGAVTIPCADDMHAHIQKSAFELTKKGQKTGTVVVSIKLDDPEVDHPAVVAKTMDFVRAKSMGGEFDNMMAILHEPHDPDKPAESIRLVEVDHPEDGQQSHAMPPVEVAPVPPSSSPGKDGAAPLVGSWKCVDTFGLEDFLKATGVGMFQRKIALSAAWPAWDFTLEGEVLKFVNHSAIGDLREDIQLDKEYDWRDGHKNLLKCKATWTGTADGGSLKITRKGDIGEYSEERAVTGDKLAFVLTHGTGVKWGRNFVRGR